MANINRVAVSGRLTRDPELRTTPGGTDVISLSIAVNDRRKNQQTGQWEDVANFVDCVMFGHRAKPLSEMLHKGDLACVDGRLRYSSWERDGQRRSKLEVIVEEIEIMAPKQPNGGTGAGYAQNGPQNASDGPSGAFQVNPYADYDYPF